MSHLNILSTAILPEEILTQLPNHYSIDMFPEKRPMNYEELYEKVNQNTYDVILCTYKDKIDGLILQTTSNHLKLIVTMSKGVDHIDLLACKEHNVKVENVPDVTTDAIADYAIALLLIGVRRLDLNLSHIYNQEPWYYMWNLHGSSLSKMTIGIVGLGKIGTAITKRLKGFDSQVIYYSRQRKLEQENIYNIQYKSFDSLLSQSDAIIVCCSLNNQTKQMFNNMAFSKMKSSCIFINIARGEICNHEALYQALTSGQISVALLDVTEPEPLPHSHNLHQLENCLILPHIATNVKNSRSDICNLAFRMIAQNNI